MRRTALLLVAACAAAALAAAGAGARARIVWCTGGDLTGSFAAVPNSAGAGNIVYRLTLRNRSAATCSVSGLPVVQLLAANGDRLPTRPVAVGPKILAVLVSLAPGKAATATARFSPDVPGPGETTTGPCERTAARLRVTAKGGGTTTVPITPPTPVCEHGQLQLSRYTHA